MCLCVWETARERERESSNTHTHLLFGLLSGFLHLHHFIILCVCVCLCVCACVCVWRGGGAHVPASSSCAPACCSRGIVPAVVCVCVCDTAHNSNVHNSNVSLKETTNRFANRQPNAPAVFRNVGQCDSHNDSFQFD